MIGIVAGWLIFSILAGVVANSRGRSGGGYFLLALVLSPLIGIVLAGALPSLKAPVGTEAITPETHVRCPDCRELVRCDAIKCKHCGTALIPQPVNTHAIEIKGAVKDLTTVGRIVFVIAVIGFAIHYLTRGA